MRRIAVYNNESFAGVLTESAPGNGYTFQYVEEYIASDGNPISLTLPLRKEAYESEHLFPFFSNMVPEGANRRMICRALQIDEDDIFGILSAMAGKDIIGSVGLKRIEK